MMRRFAIVIFFLLISQFCVFAQNWQSVGNGLTGYVNGMVVDSAAHKIYACGYWNSYHRFVQYNDSTGAWSLLGNNWTAGNTLAITIYRNEIYGVAPSGVYKLIGTNWQCVAPTHGVVLGLCQHDTDLYVYGGFDSIAGIQATKIACFDGLAWHNVGSISVNNDIYCATFFQGELYVGGNLYNSSLNAYKIMKWNGSQWDTLPGSSNCFTGGFDDIDCMATYNNELYVGGLFTYAQGGNPGNYIAAWNGNSWSAVGGGVDFQVVTMQVYDNDLWVGGAFANAGGIAATDIATWNGTDWCNVGNFDNTVDCFLVFNDTLYAGGGYWTVDGDSINKVVKWVGGNNVNACGHLNTGIQETVNNNTVKVFPNPAKGSVTFQLNGQTKMFELIITDQLGREVWRGISETDKLQLSTHDFEPGMYFYRIEEDGEVTTSGKLVIE